MPLTETISGGTSAPPVVLTEAANTLPGAKSSPLALKYFMLFDVPPPPVTEIVIFLRYCEPPEESVTLTNLEAPEEEYLTSFIVSELDAHFANCSELDETVWVWLLVRLENHTANRPPTATVKAIRSIAATNGLIPF
jgi:hypothetical protein